MSQIDQFQHLKIPLEAIQSATNYFSADNCIGRGGFGKVYKGKLIHYRGETMVALKRLDRALGQGDTEFWNEIMKLSFYRHENIVSLLGYCDDHGEKILVYEYASKKSLDSYLSSEDLTWVQRLKICIGAAHGLEYIHTPAETQLRIFHRDIKSSNVLLDDEWNAKISDFGLSKFAPVNNKFTFVVTNPAGTPGYIDPLYHDTGVLTKESDVYSFGVVLFEVLCGRLCFGNKELRPLVGLVREFYKQHKIRELVHSNIKDEIKESSLKLFADIAYQCLKRKREKRPLMKEIVSTLEKALDVQEKGDSEATVHRAGILNVNVLKVTDFENKNHMDASNHYFVLRAYRPESADRKGRFSKAGWNEESILYLEDVDHSVLYIFFYKIISVEKHCIVGMASMELKDLTPEIPLTCSVRVDGMMKSYISNLKVEMLYKPAAVKDLISSVQKAPIGTPKDGGLLVVIIHNAILHSVVHKLDSTSSLVSLLFRGKLRKTVCLMNTIYPKWVQEFTFMLEKPPTDENLHLEVIDNSWKGLIPGKGSLGCVVISLEDVVNKKWTNKFYQLHQTGLFVGSHPQQANQLQVELHWRTP